MEDMKEILKDEDGFIEMTRYRDGYVNLRDDTNAIIPIHNSKLPLFLSKLAKFADGDDRDDMAKRFGTFEEPWSEIIKDYLIIKRPTDEAGK